VTPESKPVVEPARPAAPTLAPGAKVVDPGKGRLVREGTFIVSRSGRVVRSAAGDWLFAFDSDPNSRAGSEPTMALMPCEKLMALERIAEKHGEGITYTMSGQVFVYHGRNYLLPANYTVNRPSGDIKTTQ